ncbi:hypothetical protein B0H19DRAFT_1273803 [Mycena capillaripes]|nr:hypothetical protein B0H19DRAFT_1273803 [Mycena capillaripes]
MGGFDRVRSDNSDFEIDDRTLTRVEPDYAEISPRGQSTGFNSGESRCNPVAYILIALPSTHRLLAHPQPSARRRALDRGRSTLPLSISPVAPLASALGRFLSPQRLVQIRPRPRSCRFPPLFDASQHPAHTVHGKRVLLHVSPRRFPLTRRPNALQYHPASHPPMPPFPPLLGASQHPVHTLHGIRRLLPISPRRFPSRLPARYAAIPPRFPPSDAGVPATSWRFPAPSARLTWHRETPPHLPPSFLSRSLARCAIIQPRFPPSDAAVPAACWRFPAPSAHLTWHKETPHWLLPSFPSCSPARCATIPPRFLPPFPAPDTAASRR